MLSIITPTPNEFVVSLILSPREAISLTRALERCKRTIGRSQNMPHEEWVAQYNLVEELIELFTKDGTGINRSTSKPHKL